MDFVRRSLQEGIAEIRIERPLVNAIEGRLVDELSASFRQIAEDPGVRASVLTGTGKFFSFGFDIPLFLGWSKAEFSGCLSRFTSLYREVFSHPKPVVAALNGHAVAGGCMLATACDARVMVDGKAKIGTIQLATARGSSRAR
ncbi:MAG TPA: enoyl-CoA hydratase/isomerase family protein [Myxococcales bacterium]|nr:enoyl-CoA hydratase/isomerase family protein [Myxococcales bacterium]